MCPGYKFKLTSQRDTNWKNFIPIQCSISNLKNCFWDNGEKVKNISNKDMTGGFCQNVAFVVDF